MNLEDRIMEEASKGNYNKVYALALLYLCKKYKEGIGQVVGVRNGAPLIAHFSKYIRSLKDGTRFCFIDELAGKKIGLWN